MASTLKQFIWSTQIQSCFLWKIYWKWNVYGSNGLFQFACHFLVIFQTKNDRNLRLNAGIKWNFWVYMSFSISFSKEKWLNVGDKCVGIKLPFSVYFLFSSNYLQWQLLNFAAKCVEIKISFSVYLSFLTNFSKKYGWILQLNGWESNTLFHDQLTCRFQLNFSNQIKKKIHLHFFKSWSKYSCDFKNN